MSRNSSIDPALRQLDDLSGVTFGYLTAIKPVVMITPRQRASGYLCRCCCGAEKEVQRYQLLNGSVSSCGCQRSRKTVERNTKHGLSKRPEYGIWKNIRNRCFAESTPAYDRYGGRGITMCDRWRDSFRAFYEDMGPRPSRRHTVERKDNNGDYCPENCVWATYKEQANNQRSNVVLEHNGLRLNVTQWAERLGIKPHTLAARLRRGWPVEKALATAVDRRDTP